MTFEYTIVGVSMTSIRLLLIVKIWKIKTCCDKENTEAHE